MGVNLHRQNVYILYFILFEEFISIWKLKKVTSTFALDHFDLFGLRQGLKMGNILKFAGSENFVTLFHYKLVRHPIMTGFFIMFWSVPVMTMGKFTHTRGTFTLFAVIFLIVRTVQRSGVKHSPKIL